MLPVPNPFEEAHLLWIITSCKPSHTFGNSLHFSHQVAAVKKTQISDKLFFSSLGTLFKLTWLKSMNRGYCAFHLYSVVFKLEVIFQESN